MLRPVVKAATPFNGLSAEARAQPLKQTLFLKCGHFARRRYVPGKQRLLVHCPMCEFLYGEREAKRLRKLERNERRTKRQQKQLLRLEIHNMAKTKAAAATPKEVKKKVAAKKTVAKKAPAKVAKKKDLPAKKKKKAAAAPKIKPGRKLILVTDRLYAPKGSLLAKVLKAFKDADEQTMGENALIVAMGKAGVKDDGNKTVKKMVKGLVRNLLRSGAAVKQRDVKKDEALAAWLEENEDGSMTGDETEEEDEEESDEEVEEDDSETDDEDEDEEDADEE